LENNKKCTHKKMPLMHADNDVDIDFDVEIGKSVFYVN
jgi:hypothetical protein